MNINEPTKPETWNKIRDFKMDETGAVIPFSGKLARQNKWPASFAFRATDEYKKFLYLCIVSPNGAAPSPIVDQVWHLHLTYTTSYWRDLCTNTLGIDLHHHPSKGGEQEHEKHQNWYAATLQLYKEEFKTEPPRDIWPPDNTSAIIPVDILLNELPGSLTLPVVKLSFYIIIIPFIIIKLAYGHFNPFALNGPHFLVFSSLLIASSFTCFLHFLYRRRQRVLRFVEVNAPKQYTIYQAAYFLFGQNRAVQTAIVDGLKKDAIELQDDNSFLVQQNGYDYCHNTNPLLRMLAPYKHTTLSYEQINRLLPAETFQEPAFDNLHWIAYQKKYDQWVFLHPLSVVFAARFVQGVWNDQPIFFLVIMAIISGIAAVALESNYSVRQVIYTWCRQKFEEESLATMKLNPIDEILRTHVTSGTTAVTGFSEHASLALLFGAYPTVNHFNQTSNGNGGCGSGGDGSGDGGGGLGCGGGCGGCGGD